MQSVEEFIASISKAKVVDIKTKTLFTLSRSFVIYYPEVLFDLIKDQQVAREIHNKILIKFVLTHEQLNGRYKKSFICYKSINNGKFYLFPKACVSRLIEFKILKSEQIENLTAPYFAVEKLKHKRISAFKNTEIDLTSNQLAVVNDIYARFVDPKIHNTLEFYKNPGCIVIAKTGIGKTRIGYGLIHKLRKKALVVVPNNTAIMYQWGEEARKAFSDADAIKITYYGDGHKDLDGDIVIAIINSIININGKLLDDFAITVYDECHSYCTQEFSKVFWSAQSACNIGLTASPGDRLDGFDKSLPWFIGPFVNAEDCAGFYEGDAVEFEVEINILNYYPSNKKYISYESNVQRHELIVADPERNAKIIEILTNQMREHRHTFVFCDRRIHCVALAKLFRAVAPATTHVAPAVLEQYDGNGDDNSDSDFGDAEDPYGLNDPFDPCNFNDSTEGGAVAGATAMGTNELYDSTEGGVVAGATAVSATAEAVYIMMGESSQENIQNAKYSKDKGTVIFTTYSFCRQSIDFPRMDTIILAAPRKSGSKQVIGRILRYGSDASIVRKVYDIVDIGSQFKTQFESRLAYYREKKYKINTL